jgi:DNA-binding NarL/FixJ family response regulator
VAPATDAVTTGRDALARGEWREAKASFERALAEDESPEALEGAAYASRWLGEVGAAFRLSTRAYRLYRQRDDRTGSARAAIRLALAELYFRNEPAVARGWLERAERLLDGLGPTPEAGWLELARGHLALQVDRDAERALAHDERARELGRATGAADVELYGAALAGLALVSLGRVDDGMRLLDEAAAAAVAGEIADPDAISGACCALIDACKRVRDYERATQWVDTVAEFCDRWDDRLTFVACRAHYADILIWRGAWAEAEAELLATLGPLAAVHRSRLADALVRLAELRRRQGRLADAAELVEQSTAHRLAPLVAGELALDRGDPVEARRAAERYLRRVPEELLTERAAGLELLVRAALAEGDGETAGTAAGELRAIARAVASDAVRAAAAHADGLVAAAAGRHDDARRLFEDAADLFAATGGRYEAARARQQLAAALASLGAADASAREARAAATELAALGASAQAATPAANGLSPREVEVLRLIARGRSNQAIAAELFLSVRTVERHVSNVYDKLGASGRSARAAAAAYALAERLA